MSTRYEELVALLKELFQLDHPELDFGIYRIMRVKRDEITQFLERDLLPQVKEAFASYRSADRAVLEKQLEDAVAQAKELGHDPDTTPKVRQLREQLSSSAVDVAALEADVYNHLYRFFRRYYQDGDFISRRVYKDGVYAIPYEGEEVKLYWANHDQYYVKTSEYLRDYAFRLRPNDDQNPMRVHFKLVDAAEGAHNNVKESNKRVFVLASHDFIGLEPGAHGDELVIRFEYRPATLDDWPADQREGKKKPPTQDELLTLAEQRILAVDAASLAPWIRELAASYTKASGEQADYSRLWAHLKRYTARNTFDYFIHKDLGGFLRRELDFYIKNEIMELDDIENESAPKVEQYLSKIKVIRKIAHKIIDFLAQLEDFQKKLWLKKKFVTETSWCIRVGIIPEEFYPEICANDAQREEWVQLLAIDELKSTPGDLLEPVKPGYSEPLTPEFLRAYPTLMIDTRHFDEDFTARLLEAIDDLDEKTDGILIHGENFQALSFIQRKYREQVDCVYIDPPYNAQSSEILYKNDYKHATWLTLMENRLSHTQPILAPRAVVVVAIDEVEQEVLGLLLDQVFPDKLKTCVTIVHNATGQQGNNFSATHEYAYFVYPPTGRSIGLQDRTDKPDIRPLRNVSKGAHLRSTAANCFYPILVRDGKIVGFGDVSPDDYHPGSPNIVRADGTVEVYPIDQHGVERKWVFARDTVESIRHELTPVYDERRGVWEIIRTKTRFNFKTVWTDSKYSANSWGSRILNNILGDNVFSFPKSIFTVRDSVDAALGNAREGFILDYFAGSGTTGHAVINLNREDGGRRKFLLVEMADYFDTVLLPRMKKVTFAPEWTGGKPRRLATEAEVARSPRILKILCLESYEDTINNLQVSTTSRRSSLLDRLDVQVSDDFREQYILRYMLHVETRGSRSLLNIHDFRDPTKYRLNVKVPGSDESREVCVDLMETFNWLIGLQVQGIRAPQRFSATFKRIDDPALPKHATRRLTLDGELREDPNGRWWFRVVEGETRDGRKTLVIWRNRPGGEDPEGVEQDNLVLDEWFRRQRYSTRDSEFDVIYVNGTNNLENLKTPEDTWKVRLIEEDFHRLMFSTED